jgi:non-specific serine/threonine protein kinase
MHLGPAGEACVGFPPTPNRLIGREETLLRLIDLLDRHRLVTVTGPGGVGKTRLAIEAARAVANAFDDGAMYVGLAAVRDGSLVVPTIARASGLPNAASVDDANGLASLFAETSLLLVLDNLEQVSSCAVDIAAVLNACPNLKVLATSRVILNVQAEQVFPVPPLAVPSDMRAGGASSLLDSPSVSLFVERALTHDPQFAVDRENAGNIAAICVRLDGLPLAIELAAARVRMLSLEALLPRLERRLPLLTGGARDAPARQQTLRNTLAWSYNLLSTTEQEIFRRLSVFVGGFTIEAAEAVSGLRLEAEKEGAIPADVFDVISTLADHSLVHKIGTGDDPRFGMLETIQEYGLELLESHGELDSTRQKHAEWVVGFAEPIRLAIGGPAGPAVLDQYEREHPNIRAALGYALEIGDGELGCRIVAAVWQFWLARPYEREGKQWIQRVVDLPGAITPSYRLEVLCALARFHVDHKQWHEAYRVSTDGLALARKVGNEESEAHMLALLAYTAWGTEDLEQAERLLEQALAMSCKSKPAYRTSQLPTPIILYSSASLSLQQARIDRAREFAHDALEIWRQRGDSWGIAMATEVLGAISQAEGNSAQAVETYRTCFPLFRHVGEPVGLVNCCAGIGIAAIQLGHVTSGVRLISAADTIRRELGGSLWYVHSIGQEGALADARSELGSRRFETAWQVGRELTLEEAVTEGTTLQLDRPQKSEPPFALTSRQLEILRRMADGRTDREIADELFISYRTVTTHVENILKQMGVDSRTAASTDAVRLGLI